MTRLRRLRKKPVHSVSVSGKRLGQAVRTLRRRNKKAISLLERLKLLQEKNVSIKKGALEAQVRQEKTISMLFFAFNRILLFLHMKDGRQN